LKHLIPEWKSHPVSQVLLSKLQEDKDDITTALCSLDACHVGNEQEIKSIYKMRGILATIESILNIESLILGDNTNGT